MSDTEEAEEDDSATRCQKCGDTYTLGFQCEPTPFCNECAHLEVERLMEENARLRKALDALELFRAAKLALGEK
jgi:hypothetical protein